MATITEGNEGMGFQGRPPFNLIIHWFPLRFVVGGFSTRLCTQHLENDWMQRDLTAKRLITLKMPERYYGTEQAPTRRWGQGRPPLLLKTERNQRSGVPHSCNAAACKSMGYDAGVPQFCGLTSAQKKTVGGAGTPSDGTVKGLLTKEYVTAARRATPWGGAA